MTDTQPDRFSEVRERILGRIEYPIFEADIIKIIDTEIRPLVDEIIRLQDVIESNVELEISQKVLTSLGYLKEK